VHTVIITDKHTTSLFARHRLLFEPFFAGRGGSLCHCPWHEGGNDIEQAVPDLYKSIRGHPEWRAIILVHNEQNDPPPNLHNPFDFNCNRNEKTGRSELLIKENMAPLVRLTHMLAGFPPLGVKEYQTGYTYYDGKAEKFVEWKKKDGSNMLQEDLAGLSDEKKMIFYRKFGTAIKPLLIEEPYSQDEKNEYERLTKMYALKENRPVEALILSARELSMPDDHKATRETIRRIWQFHDEEESSDFWKVYPSACRFLCYDLINPEHTLYTRDLWHFYLLALTLAVNKIPAQALQAYRLYKVDLAINADELKYTLERHIGNLMSVQSVIHERLMNVPDVPQEKDDELVPAKDISVKFEHMNEGGVKIDSNAFGLSSDCPVQETRFWHEHMAGTRQVIDNILYAPQEVVAKKALETRGAANSFAGIEQTLDRFQLERIHKRMDELEQRIINSNIHGMLDPDARMAEVAEAGYAVRKHLGLRLTKHNALFISLCSLLVYLCGYVLYFINSARIGWPVFGASFGLASIALVLLAMGGLLVLVFLRRRLVNKLKEYNKTVIRIFDRVHKSARVFADYFSNVCTYMYAHSLLSGVTLKRDNDLTGAKVQRAHLVSLEKEIEKSRELCSLHGAPVNDSLTGNIFFDIQEKNLLELPSQCQFYELAPNKAKDTLELDHTGETLYAPYSFIAGLKITREELYDKKKETTI
jgi:hypothetical protein